MKKISVWFHNGAYHFKYRDEQGKRRTGTGTADREETERLAIEKQTACNIEHDRQARPENKPRSWQVHASRPFNDVRDEYIQWGKAQGGREGYGWEAHHAHNRETMLNWWGDKLGLHYLADVDGVLARVEAEVRTLKRTLTDKSIGEYVGSLKAFCRWCVQRGYLEANPLRITIRLNKRPQSTRRALSPDDFKKVFTAAPVHRRRVYRTAFCTGLRDKELRSLSVDDLDVDRGGLQLHPEWTKDRQGGFQPLPPSLLTELKVDADAGTAAAIYARYYRGKRGKGKWSKSRAERPLLYMPSHGARDIKKDIEAAGIPITNFYGKLDFHALRGSFISCLLEDSPDVKTAQALARHKKAEMTLNTYGRSRQERLTAMVERIAASIEVEEKCLQLSTRQAVGAENVVVPQGKVVGVVGLETTACVRPVNLARGQNRSEPPQLATPQSFPATRTGHSATTGHPHVTSQDMPSCLQLSTLAQIAAAVQACASLSPSQKNRILAIITEES